jgi:hypothetical protein
MDTAHLSARTLACGAAGSERGTPDGDRLRRSLVCRLRLGPSFFVVWARGL